MTLVPTHTLFYASAGLFAIWWLRKRTENSTPTPPWQAISDQLSELAAFFGLVDDPVAVYANAVRKYPGLSRGFTFSGRMIKVRGRETLKAVMSCERDCLETGPGYPITIRQLIGESSLVLLDGPIHDHKRKAYLQGLQGSKLAVHLPSCQSAAEKTIHKWLKATEDGESLKLHSHIQSLTSSITASILFGLPPSETTEQLHTHVHAFSNGFACPIALLTGILFGSPLKLRGSLYEKGFEGRDQIFDAITQGLELLQSRKETGEYVEGENNLLDFLLAERDPVTGEPMSKEDLYSQAVTLVFASQDTASAVLSSAVILLAQHPNYIEKLHSEQVEVISKYGPTITSEALKDMPLMNAVLTEVLRLCPPVPTLGRVAKQDFTINGYIIPKGSGLWLDVWNANRDPVLFPNPDAFLPERWIKSLTNPRPLTPGHILTFGRGSHLCVGRTLATMLMPTLLATLVRESDWFLSPNQNLKPVMLMVFHPNESITVCLKSRAGMEGAQLAMEPGM